MCFSEKAEKMKETQTPRILIVGASETGKSLLAKSIARDMEKRNIAVTVYDPLVSEWSPESFVSDDEVKFFVEIDKTYKEGLKQAVFVDEADTLLSIAHKHNHWLLTRGRHYAIMPHVITQRPALVAPTVRGMCNQLFVFRTSKEDAKLLASDFAHDGILEAPTLNQGEFLHCYWKDRQKVVDKGRIF